jgi:hypothetical protein
MGVERRGSMKYTVKWLEDNLGEMRYYMHQAFTGNMVGIYQTMVNKIRRPHK